MSQRYTGTFINDLVEMVEKIVRAYELDRSSWKAPSCIRDGQAAASLDKTLPAGSAPPRVQFDTPISRAAI